MKSIKHLSKKALAIMAAYIVIKWTFVITVGSYLYSTGNWRNEYFLFFPVMGIIVIGVKNRKKLFGKKPSNEVAKTPFRSSP